HALKRFFSSCDPLFQSFNPLLQPVGVLALGVSHIKFFAKLAYSCIKLAYSCLELADSFLESRHSFLDSLKVGGGAIAGRLQLDGQVPIHIAAGSAAFGNFEFVWPVAKTRFGILVEWDSSLGLRIDEGGSFDGPSSLAAVGRLTVNVCRKSRTDFGEVCELGEVGYGQYVMELETRRQFRRPRVDYKLNLRGRHVLERLQ